MTGRRLRASFASSRPALTLFVVLAFLFQSLLTQTHVHLLTDHDSGFAVALGGNSTQLSFVPPTALVSPGSFRAVSHSWYGRGPPIA
jgi:hypothetical protein